VGETTEKRIKALYSVEHYWSCM